MHLVLVCIGSHGDVHPFIALAHALARRGVRATIATNPYFQPLCESEGVEFVGLGERLELSEAAQTKGAMSAWGGTVKLIRSLLVPQIPLATVQLERVLRKSKADGVVLHTLAVGAPTVCEQLGIPFASAMLAPLAWWNPYDRPVLSPWDPTRPPLWMSRLGMRVGRAWMRGLLDQPLNDIRAERNLPARRDHFYHLARGGVVNLGLWSPLFRGPTKGDPPTGVICGFPWFDRVRAHDAEAAQVRAFLDDGEAPITFTLGTAAVHVAGPFYECAARACASLKRRGLLLVGKPQYAPKDLPPSVRAFSYAPFSEVFPRSRTIVHHGGIGTTAQGLRAGKPTLVCAMAHDQFDNGARLKRLSVALRTTHGRITQRELTEKLERLEDPKFTSAAAALAPEIAREDGAARAAEELVRAFGKKDAAPAKA